MQRQHDERANEADRSEEDVGRADFLRRRPVGSSTTGVTVWNRANTRSIVRRFGKSGLGHAAERPLRRSSVGYWAATVPTGLRVRV